MRKAVIAAFAILAIAAGVYLQRYGATWPPAAAQTPAAKGPAAQPPGVPVTGGTVAVSDVPIILNGIGSVQASHLVTIKSRVDGQIVSAEFAEGQQVTAGTTLYQIDPRPFESTLEQALANKRKDEAQLVNVEADLARWAELAALGIKSRQTYDQAKAQAEQLRASIAGDEAQIAMARLTLSYATIRAPVHGRLGARLVDAGNMVRAAEGVGLVTIAQIQPVQVSFTVPQEHQHKVREKQARAPLEVIAYGGDGKTLLATGKLTLIDNTIDQATGTLRLKATFANADERLWPGEFVNVRLVLNIRRGVATVPAQTVQDGPTGHYAYVIKDDNTVERRKVEVAAVQDGLAVVSKGLAAGEKIVVEGQYRLTQGARVRLAAPKPDVGKPNAGKPDTAKPDAAKLGAAG
jgi:multidrug efflux system membrane fusion protein